MILEPVRPFLERAWSSRVDEAEEPDRVLATVLFTDIVGSSDHAVTLGDRAWRERLEEHHELVRRQLLRYRGVEVDTAGDGFFASFDGPARAIRCASAITSGVRELGLDVRAGLHTGECELVDGKVAGIAVHTGARVASHAQPERCWSRAPSRISSPAPALHSRIAVSASSKAYPANGGSSPLRAKKRHEAGPRSP